jgi:alpha-beta hydrolase superfamily lysophospholipase
MVSDDKEAHIMGKDLIDIHLKNDEVLYGRSWTIGNPKANIIIVTGMLEHSNRYDDFARFLNQHGYDVFCFDHYGQGENVKKPGEYGVWPKSGFSKSVKNLDLVVSRLRVSCRPTYILGHSMGSFIVQDYIQRYTEHVNKVVLCGTSGKKAGVNFAYLLSRVIATKKRRNRPSPFLSKLCLGNCVTSVKNRKTDCDWLSYNETNVEKYNVDPLCGGTASGGFYREFFKGLNRLYKRRFLKKIRDDISILIIGGAQDPVGEMSKGPKKLYNLYKTIGIKSVDLIIYPHMRHEILNETDHEIVYQDILKFFSEDTGVAEQMLAQEKEDAEK